MCVGGGAVHALRACMHTYMECLMQYLLKKKKRNVLNLEDIMSDV